MIRRALVLAAAVAALAYLATADVPSLTSQARAGAAYPKSFSTTDDAAVARASALGRDHLHSLQILANLRAEPPEQPVVLFLGGSSAR